MGVPVRMGKCLVTQCKPREPIRKESINIMRVLFHQMSSSINIYHQPLRKNTWGHSDCEWGPSRSLQTCTGDVIHYRFVYSYLGTSMCAREQRGSPLLGLAVGESGKKVTNMLGQSGAKGQADF